MVKWLCREETSIASVMCPRWWVQTINLKKVFFFSRSPPDIRHEPVYRFWIPPVIQVIVAPQSRHVANPCEDISISINIVKCIKQQALVISPSKAIFERNAVIFFYLHSHLEHQWHLVFAKIMNDMLFWGFTLNLYAQTSSLCRMVLLGTSPTSFY